MRIKTAFANNEYVRAGDVWVRNFTKRGVSPVNPSHLYSRSDYQMILKNEEKNKRLPKISQETLRFSKVLIVSDGYDFDKRHRLVQKMPKDICILTINGALKAWKLSDKKLPSDERRTINAHVINNPYRESLMSLPERESMYYPTCVSSIRTSFEFCQDYQGSVYTYIPTPEKVFGYGRKEAYFIDDYRNPICAAIGLAYQFGVRKLMLMCCDDSKEEKKSQMVQLENGLWTYPHHLRSQEIIDANLHWLTHEENKEVKVVDFSSGNKYQNAVYINREQDVLDFFIDQEE